jgi:4-hydroxy-3-methylbut-2-enyl diphosphate reductase
VLLDPAAGGVGAVPLPGADRLAAALRIAGLRVHLGAVGGADAVVTGTARTAWAQRGALAVDMESGVLARTGRLAAVVRAIVDTPVHPLVSPGTLPRGTRALRSLRRAAPVLSAWAAGRGESDIRERQASVVDITITLPGEVENS